MGRGILIVFLLLFVWGADLRAESSGTGEDRAPNLISVRWMIQRDLEEVLRIEKETYGDKAWRKDDFYGRLKSRSVIGMVGVNPSDQVVSYMIYELGAGRLDVLSFTVDESQRGQGTGSKMLEKLIAKMSLGLRSDLRIRLRADHTQGLDFLQKRFVKSETLLPNYFGDGADAVEYVHRPFSKKDAAPVERPVTIVGPKPERIHEEEIFARSAGRFRFGGEMEVRAATAFRPFLRQYQVDVLRSDLKPKHVDDYLEDSSHLASLSEELQQQLTKGLDLTKAKKEIVLSSWPEKSRSFRAAAPLEWANLEGVPGSLLMPEWARGGRILTATPGIQAPVAKLILPKKAPADETASEGVGEKDLIVGASYDHSLLDGRWRALPLEVKQAEVDPNLLAPSVLQDYLADGPIAPTKYRESTPPKIRNLLDKFSLGPEGSWWEFRHKDIEVPAEQYLGEMEGLMLLGQVAPQLNNPLSRPYHRRSDATYHLHVSTTEDRDLTSLAFSYNRLLLLRGIYNGFGPDLFSGEGLVTFKDDVKADYALLRLIAPNHLELRDRYQSPRKELLEILELLQLPEAQALAVINNEIQDLLTKRIQDHVHGVETGVEVKEFLLVRFRLLMGIVQSSSRLADSEHQHLTMESEFIVQHLAHRKLAAEDVARCPYGLLH